MRSLTAIRFEQLEDTAEAASPAAAARSAWARIDALIETAPGRDGWACRPGCAACCHLLVRITPGEADALVEHVRSALPEDERARLAGRLAESAAATEGVDAGAYRRARLRCAFLDPADRCLVYAARPVMCRVHASRSAPACGDVAELPPLDTWLSKVGRAIHAGLDEAPLEEMHQAVTKRL